MKHRLNIDIETYSDIDISAGVYKYSESENFEILLFAYSMDGEPVKVIDLTKQKLPSGIVDMIVSDECEKYAFNASFERVCLSRYIEKHFKDKLTGYGSQDDHTKGFLSPDSWYCTMVASAYNGYPLSLKGAGEALSIDKHKLESGKKGIAYFCCPCKPTRSNAMRTRNLPEHNEEAWKKFIEYNRRDVEAEMEIADTLPCTIPAAFWEEYHQDQRIADRGIEVDIALVEHAIDFIDKAFEEDTAFLKQRTGLGNPASPAQMKKYLQQCGYEIDSVDRIKELMNSVEEPLKSTLEAYLRVTKSSLAKYKKIKECVCRDNRVRGMYQFCGTHTHRWAGRSIQFQNLPQNHIEDLDMAREMLRLGDYESFKLMYGDVQGTLSELIRTVFIAGEGRKIIVSDYSQIEARCLALIAAAETQLDIFRNDEDLYCRTASAMYGGIPVEKTTKDKPGQNEHLRKVGKIASLALGYGSGINALRVMGDKTIASKSDAELEDIKLRWRKANPNIVGLWRAVGNAVALTMSTGRYTLVNGIGFAYYNHDLRIKLPSGYEIIYPGFIVDGRDLSYMGVNSLTRKWERIRTYGAKLVENIVQSYARDIIANAIGVLSSAKIVGMVHDELLVEAEADTPVETVEKAMESLPQWAKQLPLKAKGYESPYYLKD